jgi:drug/metabolite transporter (DMT)-like permease
VSSAEEKNKALVRRFLQAHGKGDLDALEELLAPDFVNHNLLPGHEPARKIRKALLLPLGLVGIGTFYLLYFYAVRESTVGTAAILLYSAPAFVVVLAWLFLKEPLNALKVFALVLTVGEIVLVAGAYDLANLEVSPKVLLTGLLSGFTYGLYAILGRPWPVT